MKHYMPKVTIITVTYNLLKAGRREIFKQNLESVHEQTYKNIEHLIIDGGSTDGTLEILQNYSKRGWIRYISEPDNGIYHAMNKGILQASGDYIAFLNSDDFYHKSTGVAETISLLLKSNAAFSYADCNEIDKDGKVSEYRSNLYRVFNFAPFYHLTMFTRKSVLIKESMFDERYRIAADCDLIIRLCIKGYHAIKVPHNFATFRKGGISSSIDDCISELTEINFKNFFPLGATFSQCRQMVWKKYLPFLLFKNLLLLWVKTNFIFGLRIFLYYFIFK